MDLKNRFGAFLILAGVIFLFIFAASVLAQEGTYNVLALLIGAAFFTVGWIWRASKPKGRPPAGAPPAAPREAAPPAVAKTAILPPRKRGLLTTILKGPPPKKTAPPPPPPPPPPKKRGLSAIFSPKPKRK